MKKIVINEDFLITYLGLGLEVGPLPAFFYFSLSAEESLELHPYNQPALFASDNGLLRVFSMDIPGHGPGLNKFDAMQYWADRMVSSQTILEDFFNQAVEAIATLIDQGWVDPDRIAVGGLSRGGFIATHLAARDERIQTVLGFAPLTQLMSLKEFDAQKANSELKSRSEKLDLNHLVDKLSHVHNFRFYIGNRDMRVGTDACYHFIRALAESSHKRRARHQQIELMISQSIGHKGHGTASSTFKEGAEWIKQCLI